MVKTKKLNQNFRVGDKVVCIWGSNKGLQLEIALVLPKNSYSCVDKNGNYYEYCDNTLQLADVI